MRARTRGHTRTATNWWGPTKVPLSQRKAQRRRREQLARASRRANR